MDRRQFLLSAAILPILRPKPEDDVDRWIRKVREEAPPAGPLPFDIPEELLDDINRRGGFCIVVN